MEVLEFFWDLRGLSEKQLEGFSRWVVDFQSKNPNFNSNMGQNPEIKNDEKDPDEAKKSE